MEKSAKAKVDLRTFAQEETLCEISIGLVEVDKLSAGDIAAIMVKFPAIGELFNEDSAEVSLITLAESAPDSIPEIIARATPGHLESLDGAKRLCAEDQIKLLSWIFERTFPGGLASFFTVLVEIFNKVKSKDGAKSQESTQKQQPYRKKR